MTGPQDSDALTRESLMSYGFTQPFDNMPNIYRKRHCKQYVEIVVSSDGKEISATVSPTRQYLNYESATFHGKYAPRTVGQLDSFFKWLESISQPQSGDQEAKPCN